MAALSNRECYNYCRNLASFVAIAARQDLERLKCVFVGLFALMADSNNASAPKKWRSSDCGVQFSLNFELPRTHENRLLGIKERIKMAKCALNLTKATSNSQNADLMEALLLALEEKIERRSNISSLLSVQSTPMTDSASSCSSTSRSLTQPVPIPVATSTPRSRTSLPFSDPVSPITSQQHAEEVESSRYNPHKSQISTPATENDHIYLCSEGALRTLFSFFPIRYRPSAVIAENRSSLIQFHSADRVMQCLWKFCVCGDSFKWLSSPIMGGSTPKYYVNMR